MRSCCTGAGLKSRKGLFIKRREDTDTEGKARQKPHKCEAYGRQFWFSADLHQHQKQHSGEKFFRKDETKDSEKLQNLCDGEDL